MPGLLPLLMEDDTLKDGEFISSVAVFIQRTPNAPWPVGAQRIDFLVSMFGGHFGFRKILRPWKVKNGSTILTHSWPCLSNLDQNPGKVSTGQMGKWCNLMIKSLVVELGCCMRSAEPYQNTPLKANCHRALIIASQYGSIIIGNPLVGKFALYALNTPKNMFGKRAGVFGRGTFIDQVPLRYAPWLEYNWVFAFYGPYYSPLQPQVLYKKEAARLGIVTQKDCEISRRGDSSHPGWNFNLRLDTICNSYRNALMKEAILERFFGLWPIWMEYLNVYP